MRLADATLDKGTPEEALSRGQVRLTSGQVGCEGVWRGSGGADLQGWRAVADEHVQVALGFTHTNSND